MGNQLVTGGTVSNLMPVFQTKQSQVNYSNTYVRMFDIPGGNSHYIASNSLNYLFVGTKPGHEKRTRCILCFDLR